MNKISMSVSVASFLLSAGLAVAASDPQPIFAQGTHEVIHYHSLIQGTRGVLHDLTYDAELVPDPEDPSHAIGIGHYSGFVVYHNTNCHNNLPDNPVKVPVSGDLTADARVGMSLEENSRPTIRYLLTTLDWRLNPFVFDPGLYPDADWTTYYASTPEQIEMAAGLGTVMNDLVKGTPLTGNPTVFQHKDLVYSNGCDGVLYDQIDEQITAVVESEEVKAIPDVSTFKFRGEKVVLDGSRSTPNNRLKQYHWKLEPSSECPAGTQTKEFDGKRVEVQLLCPARATLTVSTDPGPVSSTVVGFLPMARTWLSGALNTQSDTQSTDVHVQPRLWKTHFEQMPNIGQLTSAPPLIKVDGGEYVFGRNVCRYDGLTGEQHSNHFVHSGPATGPSDLLKAVVLKQVQDSKSPSNGMWYVDSKQFEVARAALVHPELFRSVLSYENEKRCQVEKIKPCGFDLLMESTRAHELMHGTLMKEKLDELRKTHEDPAQLIESMQNAQHDDLLGATLAEISKLEDKLGAATTEENVHARLKQVENGKFNVSGFIWLPSSSAPGAELTKFNIPNFADIGD
jgi:hypothetical protein